MREESSKNVGRGEGSPRRKLVVIVPAFNEAHQAGAVVEAVLSIADPLAKLGLDPQLVVIDDGSDDGTSAAFRTHSEGKGIPVRLIRFQRNFGKDAAMLAGLSNSEGDFYVLVDADGQTPFSLIPEMAKTLLASPAQVIFAVKKKEPYGLLRNVFTHAFYWIARHLGIPELERGLSDFMLFSRRVRDRLLGLHERDIVVRNMIRWINEPSLRIPFSPRRSDRSQWPIRQLFWLAIKSIMSFSHILRINFFFALIYWIISVIYGTIIVYQKILGKIVVGLSTTTLLILISFGMLFFMIAIIGEYLIAIFEEIKRRPRYFIESIEDIKPVL